MEYYTFISYKTFSCSLKYWVGRLILPFPIINQINTVYKENNFTYKPQYSAVHHIFKSVLTDSLKINREKQMVAPLKISSSLAIQIFGGPKNLLGFF